eukprot:915876-Pyramimonas_sp.AAC.1
MICSRRSLAGMLPKRCGVWLCLANTTEKRPHPRPGLAGVAVPPCVIVARIDALTTKLVRNLARARAYIWACPS